MDIVETISDRIIVKSDSMNADVFVDGKKVKSFKDHEMAYIDATRFALDIAMKHTYLD